MFTLNQLKQSFALIKFTRATQQRYKSSIAQVINNTIKQEIKNNKNILSLGQTQFPQTDSTNTTLQKHDGDRFWEAPVTPVANAGIAIGAALLGVKPITHFSSYSNGLQAIDHIVNSSAKLRYMSAGILSGAPIFRAQNGPVEGYGAQNSQCFAAWYGSIPGLVTIAPYDVEDYQGLLRTALKSSDPVLILQQTSRFNEEVQISQDIIDQKFNIPFGKAKIMQRGRHVTLVAFSQNVKLALDASTKLLEKGIQCEVINLRSIKPIDSQTIARSVQKTGRIISIQNGYPIFGVGAHIASILFQKCFSFLDAPLVRVTARDISLPYSKNLQKMALPQVQDVIKAVEKIMKGVKIN